jgi:hypothetical protein
VLRAVLHVGREQTQRLIQLGRAVGSAALRLQGATLRTAQPGERALRVVVVGAQSGKQDAVRVLQHGQRSRHVAHLQQRAAQLAHDLGGRIVVTVRAQRGTVDSERSAEMLQGHGVGAHVALGGSDA